MQKWDFEMLVTAADPVGLHDDFESHIVDAGKEGWELVSVVPQTHEGEARYIFFFKRPLSGGRVP